MSAALSEGTVPNPTAVIAELWISFVSLLRSHLGALQITNKLANVKLVETSGTSLRIGDLSGNVELVLNLSSGKGKYQQLRCGEATGRGDWMLNPDATASIDGDLPTDMELVVEAFARKLIIGLPGEMGPQQEIGR